MISAAPPVANVRGLWARSTLWERCTVLGAVALLVSLPFLFRLDGHQHADWLQFLGRFHPALVHLPIGMLVLLPLLEFAGNARHSLREAAAFVLHLALLTGAVTLFFGILLAYGSGVVGATVTRHMWGAIVLVIELVLCETVRPAWASGRLPRLYPSLLAVSLLTLGWTAHQGGSLTHGSDYLTRYMPHSLQRIFPSASAASDAAYVGSVYMQTIHPILDAKCVACHGSNKEQGGLRLDFYDLLMKGGSDGSVIAVRSPDQSLLLQRVTLSPSDRHFMPAEGRTPLSPTEIAALRAWVLAGASPTATSVPGISSNAEHADGPLQPVGDYTNLMGEIREMQRSEGAKLVAVSAKPSDGLILRTVDVASKFDDAQLAQFQRFAPFIVEAELGRTAVTDACFDTLGKFSNLRALHLEGTAITGRGLGKLTSLSQLSYLNLSGTKIATDALAPLKSMPNLRHIYLFDTPAEPAPEATDTTRRSTQ
ncbi:MAG TPA: c-type cytochrome domain-containing protein [Candidatus Sulfotelmatobacter sp.]|nr:c-type cytochrome domain-containing protein [Candidatus Sulfotelmatobacter sp.]